MKRLIIFLLIVITIFFGCKKENKTLHRTFLMGAAPFQFVTGNYSASSDFTFEGFRDNVDIVSLHTDNFFGIPWDEFTGEGKRVEVWHKKMEMLKMQISNLKADIYLSLTPLNGFRNGIAAKAYDDNGTLKTDENWKKGCFNFDSGENAQKIRSAYLNYTKWMVNFFKPKFLSHGIEINMYENSCPGCYESLIRLLNEVYTQEKARNPGLQIFPTFTMSHLWGYDDDSDTGGKRETLIKNIEKQKNILRDRFGVSAYPIFQQWKWSRIPQDFFTAVRDITGETVVFGETGQGNRNVVIPWPGINDPCFTLLRSSNDAQREYMEFLFNNANKLGSDLVIWWSLRDYLPKEIPENCPCSFQGIWCAIYTEMYKTGLLGAWMMWGSMGIMEHDLVKKPVYDYWRSWINREIIKH